MKRPLLCLLCCLLPVLGYGVELPEEVSMSVGESVLLVADVKRTALGSGRVVSLAVPEKGQLLLFGEAEGETSAQIWLVDGSIHQLQIRVRDREPGKRLAQVQQLLALVPGVSARVSGRFIVLEGARVSAGQRARVAEIAALFPGEVLDFVGEDAWESMVQMQVRLVEVRRDQLSKLGLRWDQDAAGPSVSARAGGGSGGLSVSAAFSSELASRIDLLQQQGMAYTLAEPVLSCRSGGVARFVAGGEIPLPVTDGLGSTDIQFKEYGMILEVRPRADSTGAVQAEIQIELSQIDTSVSAGDYPGFLKRQTSTAINAMEGETVAIAGMTLLERGRDRAGVPGLSAIPGLGSLFRTTRRLHRETELLVLITPRIHKGGVIGPGDDSGQQQLFERASGLQQEGELQ